MNGTLDLAAVYRHTVAGLQIGGAVQLNDLTVLVGDDLVALDDICTHQANLAVGLEALELRRRYHREVALLDIQLTGERYVTAACGLVLGVIGQGEDLGLILRVVGNNHLDGLGDSHTTDCSLVELLTDAVLKQTDIYERICLCDTSAAHKLQNGGRGVAAAAQTAQGGHTRIVPPLNVVLKYQLTQVTLGHDRVGHVQASKLALLGMVRQRAVIDNPLVQRTMVLELDRAHGVRDAFQCVLNRVRKVIERIDAPLVTLTVMVCADDAVDRRVTHVHVGRRHIDLGTQGLRTIRELAVAHVLEQLQVLLDRTITVRAVLARLGQRAAVLTDFVLGQVAHVRLACLDECNCAVIAGLKVIRAVEDTTVGHLTGQPLDIFLNGLYIFVVLTHRVGVVKTQIELTIVLLSDRPVDVDRLSRADVQVAVGLGRETGVDLLIEASRNVGVNDISQKVFDFFHGFK